LNAAHRRALPGFSAAERADPAFAASSPFVSVRVALRWLSKAHAADADRLMRLADEVLEALAPVLAAAADAKRAAAAGGAAAAPAAAAALGPLVAAAGAGAGAAAMPPVAAAPPALTGAAWLRAFDAAGAQRTEWARQFVLRVRDDDAALWSALQVHIHGRGPYKPSGQLSASDAGQQRERRRGEEAWQDLERRAGRSKEQDVAMRFSAEDESTQSQGVSASASQTPPPPAPLRAGGAAAGGALLPLVMRSVADGVDIPTVSASERPRCLSVSREQLTLFSSSFLQDDTFYRTALAKLAPGADIDPALSESMLAALRRLLLGERRAYLVELVKSEPDLEKAIAQSYNARAGKAAQTAALLLKLSLCIANEPWQRQLRPLYATLSEYLGLEIVPPLKNVRGLVADQLAASTFAPAMEMTESGSVEKGTFGAAVSMVEMVRCELATDGIRAALPQLQLAGDLVLPMTYLLDGRRMGKRSHQTAYGYKIIFEGALHPFRLDRAFLRPGL